MIRGSVERRRGRLLADIQRIGGGLLVAALVVLVPLSRAASGPVGSATFDQPPSEVLIGETFSFTVDFANTGDAPGYGPYVDVVLPQTGADGAGAATDDGVSFVGATYGGQSLQATTLTFDGAGHATHPYARDSTGAGVVVNGTPGDQLVVLRLPFGSYVPAQPEAPIVVTTSTSNLADAGAPLTIKANAGFMFGSDPTDNPTADASIIGSTATTSVTPTVIRLRTTYIGPENETATGPNWPRQYKLSVDVPTGQTVTNLDVTDVLPNNVQFVAVDSTSATTSTVSTPSTTTPGGTLTRRFASVTGTSSTEDATVTFSVYVPRATSLGGAVINAGTGSAASAVEDARASGSWTPIDGRDSAGTVSTDATASDHTLAARSIAVQDAVSDVTNPGAPHPQDVLDHTLSTEISDFFAFDNVQVVATISDGQLFDSSFDPTIDFLRDGINSAGAFDSANYTVVSNGDGTSTITFDVSAELADRGFTGGRVLGGCVPNGGIATPTCATNFGATEVTIDFHSTIATNFTNPPAGRNPSVDEADVLTDAVQASANVLNTGTLAGTGSTASDTSGAQLTIVAGALAKTVYAINGTPCPCGSPIKIEPGDTVTYALSYTTPFSAIEDFHLTDYLPLPIFDATDVTSFSPTQSATAPAAGSSHYGPSDTFHSLAGAPTPSFAADADGNSVTWTYAGYNRHPTDPSSTIQVLFTVTASDEPFADGLFLTNQGQFTDQTTNSVDATANTINQIQIQEPSLSIQKGAVATSDPTNALLNPATVGPVTFNAPGTAGARWTGTVDSAGLAATAIDSDVSGLQKGDLVTFAVTVENTGSSPNGAFDVKLKDTLPTGFVVPAGGLNLRVADGTGSTIGFTDLGGGLLGSGIQLNDGATGALGASSAPSGTNIAVVTYDLKVASTVVTNQTITNTATLFGYAGTEGGPTFTAGVTDTATATTGAFATAKAVAATSETFTSANGVAIGEVVRYRLQLQVPETGTLSDTQIHDQLPNGMTFLDDGTAKAMFVMDGGGMTSSGTNAISGGTLGQTGDDTSVGTLTPTFILPDANVSSSMSTDNDTYGNGTDVFFKLGDLTNSDGDSDAEYVVVEFNAVVGNVSSNALGTNLSNTFFGQVSGTQVGPTSAAATVTVQTPQLTLAKTTTTGQVNADDTVSYRLVLSNSNNANATTGHELTITDALPTGLTLSLASVQTSTTGTVGMITDSSTGNTVSVAVASVAKNSSVTVTFDAHAAATLTPGQVLTNTGSYTATSLSGTNGNTGNGTGSDTPGTSGSATGERTGDGAGANNLHGTGSVNVTVYLSSLAGTIYTDINNNGQYDAGTDAPIQGRDVTLTGTDHLGNAVNTTVSSAANGSYSFTNLRGGTYTITKDTAVKALEGSVTVGSQGGSSPGPRTIDVTIATGTNVTGTGNNIGEILRADLSVVKTVGQPLYVLGQTVTYTLDVANGGPSDATATVVTDTLPANTTFVTATPTVGSCSRVGSTVTCNLGTVLVGDTPSITITVTPTTTGTFTNAASISSGVVDPTPGNNSSQVDTKIESLSPTKSLVTTSEASTSANDLAIGEIARYRLVVTLPEVPTLANFELHDVLPAGLTYLDDGSATVAFVANAGGITSSTLAGTGLQQSGSSPTGITPTFALPDSAVSNSPTAENDSYADDTDVYFKLGTVTNGDADGSADQEFAIVEFNAIASNVAASTGGRVLSNTFQPQLGATALGPASGAVTDTVRVPALTQTKAVSATTADARDVRTFTVTIANPSGATGTTAFDAHLTDTLPAGWLVDLGSITVTPSGGAAGAVDHSTGNTVDVTVDTLPQTASVVVTYDATVADAVLPGATLTNTEATTWTTLPGSGTGANGTGSTAGAAGGATGERTGAGGTNNLTGSASKTVTLNNSSLSGTIYLDVDHSSTRNGADVGISGKTVTLTGTDHLGNAVSTTATTDAAGAYSFTGLRPGTYTITKDPAFQRAEGTIAVGTQGGTAGARSITAISLPAGVSTTGTGNDIGEEIEADLALTKTVNAPVVPVGDDVVFTITVTNDGPSPATNVTVTDPLPGGLTFQNATPTQGTCGLGGATVTCNLGTLAPSDSATVLVTAVGVAGNYSNTATVSATEDDPDASDDSDTVPVSVQGFSPVKSVVATSEAATTGSNVAVGEIVRYRLEVTIPKTALPDVQVQDQLPGGLQFLDDGTAKVALVDGGGVTSSTLSGTGLHVIGDETNVGTVTPTFILPDIAVSKSSSSDDDSFADGDDVYFKLGDLTDGESDGNKELAVVEFNAIVTNVASNQAGTTLANVFQPRKNGSASGPASASVDETVLAPRLTFTKAITPPRSDAGDTVTVTLTLANASTAGTGTAFDSEILDTVPAGLTRSGNATVTLVGGATGSSDGSSGATVDVTVDEIPPGGKAVVSFPATVDQTVLPGQSVTNTASATATTLPASGTLSNPTGSFAGSAGGTTGERDGSGGVDDLSFTDSDSATVRSSTLSGHVFVDVDETGTLTGGDTLVAAKTLTLTGTDHLGNAVNRTTTTDGSGAYSFTDLRPGTYTITKDAAVLRADGTPVVGAQASGTPSSRTIASIVLPTGADTDGTANDFPELIRSDIQVVKLATPPVVLLGDDASFQIEVTNNGPSPATGVTLDDPLPTGYPLGSHSSSQGTCALNAGTLSCSLGSMAVGDVATITLHSSAPLGSYPNTATGHANQIDPTPGNDEDSATVSVEGFAPTKSVPTTSEAATTGTNLAIGEIVRYRLAVMVPESPTIDDLQLHDRLPAGLQFLDDGTARVAFVADGAGIGSSTLAGAGLSKSGDQTSVGGITPTFQLPDAAVSTDPATDDDTYADGDDVYFKLGDVTNIDGDSDATSKEYAVVELNAIVLNDAANQAGRTLANDFEVLLRGASWSGPTSNVDTETVTVPDLSITKSTTSPEADAADTVPFRIVVSNASGVGIGDALDTVVDDPLPAGLSLAGPVTVTPSGGASGIANQSSSGEVKVVVDDIPAGGSVAIDYNATLSSTVTPGQTLTNTATLTSSTLAGDGSSNPTGSNPGTPGSATGERDGSGVVNDLTDSADATVTIHTSVLAGTVYLDADQDNDYDSGDSGVSGKTVTLTGTDHLGNAVSRTTTTDTNGDYGFNQLRPGTYTVTKGAAIKRAEGVANVGSQASGTAARRSISGITLPRGADTNGVGNDFPELIQADLRLTKSGQPATVVDGDTVTFTLTVTNDGPSDATGVHLEDPVPSALQVTGVTTDTGTCSVDVSTNTVSCDLGAMNAGTTAVVEVTTHATTEGTFTNTATVTQDQPDPNNGNNGSSSTTYVQRFQPVKSIVSSSEADTAGSNAAIGEIVRYRLRVTLSESPGMNNVQLEDDLPAGLQYIDDGTADVVFVSNEADIVSSTLSGAGLLVTGDDSTVDSITPSMALPDAAISSSSVGDDDTFGPGDQVYFKLGDLVDNDSDADNEYAVVEFNALVTNVAGNQAGTTLDNGFTVHLGANPNTSTSLPVPVTVVAPQLAVTKSVAQPESQPGETVSFHVVLTADAGANRATAYETVLEDVLPAGLSLVPASVVITPVGGAAGVADDSIGNTVRASVATMPPGASVDVVYDAVVGPSVAAGDTVTNDASFVTTTLPGDGTSSNPTGSTTPGASGEGTGERDGSGGVDDLTDHASSSFSAYDSSLSGHVFLDRDENDVDDPTDTAVAGRTLTLTGADYLGNVVSLTRTTDANGDYTFTHLRAGTYSVTKAVAVGAADRKGFAGSNGGSVAVRVVTGVSLPPDADTDATGYDFSEMIRADLQLRKSVAQPAVILGESATFTLTATNNGPSDATGVTVDDTLPADLSFVSATPDQGSCSWSSPHIVCTLGSLAAGNSTSVKVEVTARRVGVVTNTAVVSATQIDPSTDNNSARSDLRVNPVPIVADLQVTKTVDQPSVQAGTPATFTIVATNNGPDAVNGVRLVDTLPAAGAIAGPAKSSKGTCAFSTPTTVTCEVGTLAPGESANVTEQLTPSGTGTFVNTVTISGALDRETDPTNNTATASVTGTVASPQVCTITSSGAVVTGTAGNDVICVMTGRPHTIRGGGGKDIIYGSAGADRILGGSGNDTIYGGGGKDVIDGGAGTDILCGGAGADTIYGGLQNDGVSGGPGNDRIIGGAGNDGLYGDAGNDIIYGGDGHDRIVGGPGRDSLHAHDSISDLIVGGTGRDFAILDLNRDFFRTVEREEMHR